MKGIQAMYLYHGTDSRTLKMSDEDRASLRENLFITLDYLWELSSPYYDPLDYKKLEAVKHQMDDNIFENFRMALNRENARRTDLKQWQYQNNVTYFTKYIQMAAYFAYESYVFGELGRTTWDIYIGLKSLNLESWHPTILIINTLNTLKELAEGTPDPVICVLPLSDFAYTNLRSDQGKEYDEISSDKFSCEHDGSFSLCKGHNIIHLHPGGKYFTLKLK